MSIKKYLGESGTEKVISTLASCRGICDTQLDKLSNIITELNTLIEDMNKIVNNIEILDSSSSSSEEEQSSSSIGEEEIGFIATWEKEKTTATEISGDASVFLNSWRPVLVNISDKPSSDITPEGWLMRNNWLRYMDDNTGIEDSDDFDADSPTGKFAPTIGITEDDAYDLNEYGDSLYILSDSVTNNDNITASEFYDEYEFKSIEDLWETDKALIKAELENNASGTSYDNPLPECPTQVYVGVDTSNILNNKTISLSDGSEISISSYLILSKCTYLGHDVYFDAEFDLCIVVTTTIDSIETENVMMCIFYDDDNVLKYNSEKDYYYYSDDKIINNSEDENNLYKISSGDNIVYTDKDNGDYYVAYNAYCENKQLFTDKDGNIIYYFNDVFYRASDSTHNYAISIDDGDLSATYTDIYGYSVTYDSNNNKYVLKNHPDFQVPEKYIITSYKTSNDEECTHEEGCYGYFMDASEATEDDVFDRFFYKDDNGYYYQLYYNNGYYYIGMSGNKITVNNSDNINECYIKIVDESDVSPVYIFRKLEKDVSGYYTIDNSENYSQERILIPVSHILRPWETTETDYTIGVASTRDQYIIDEYLYRGINLEKIDSNSHDNYILNAGTAICPGPPFSNSEGALRNFFFIYNIGGENSSGGDGFYSGINTFNGSSEYENRNHARLELLSDMGSSSNYNWQTLAQANNSDSSSTTPFSVMGYHPLNALITGCEALYGSKNLYSTDLFGYGLNYLVNYDNTTNNSDNDDIAYCKTGGIWWKITQVTNTDSYADVIDSTWENGDMEIQADASTNDDKSIIWFATNNYNVCMNVPMEAQMALSYAMEVGIPAGTFFTFYGNVYCWSDVDDSGTYGPENGYFNARICKILQDDWYYSRSSQYSESEDLLATAEVIFFLRYSLYMGIDLAGEFSRNCDNGVTINVSPDDATLSELVLELNPSDSNSGSISIESKTIEVGYFDQRYNFTPIPCNYDSIINEGYAWVSTEESEDYTGSLYVGGRGMPRSMSIYNNDASRSTISNDYTFGSLQFMVNI